MKHRVLICLLLSLISVSCTKEYTLNDDYFKFKEGNMVLLPAEGGNFTFTCVNSTDFTLTAGPYSSGVIPYGPGTEFDLGWIIIKMNGNNKIYVEVKQNNYDIRYCTIVLSDNRNSENGPLNYGKIFVYQKGKE